MDVYRREQKIADDVKKAIAKLNHLSALIKEADEKVKACRKEIEDANKKLKELHNER